MRRANTGMRSSSARGGRRSHASGASDASTARSPASRPARAAAPGSARGSTRRAGATAPAAARRPRPRGRATAPVAPASARPRQASEGRASSAKKSACSTRTRQASPFRAPQRPSRARRLAGASTPPRATNEAVTSSRYGVSLLIELRQDDEPRRDRRVAGRRHARPSARTSAGAPGGARARRARPSATQAKRDAADAGGRAVPERGGQVARRREDGSAGRGRTGRPCWSACAYCSQTGASPLNATL